MMSNPSDKKKYILQSNSAGVFLVILLFSIVFFDIVFLQASIQPSNVSGISYRDSTYQQDTYIKGRKASHLGFRDVGSTYLQNEPARHFVARSIKNKESIFWNPYSATGTYGPEQLVDLKVSPITITAALFGASPNSYDLGIMFFMAIGAVFLLLTLQRFFSVSNLPALAAVAIFLLNGFSTSNLGSQNAQPYIVAPLFLYALLSFAERATLFRAIILCLAQSALALITLLPVLITVFIFCYSLALVWHLEKHQSLKNTFKTLFFFFVIGLISFMLVAPVYFPIVAALLDSNLSGKYQQRAMLFSDYRGLLDLVSSQHFWNNFNAPPPPDNIKELGIKRYQGTIAHVGIGALLITGSSLLSKKFWRPTNILLAFIIGYYLYMILNLPGAEWWFKKPIIQTLNSQYISPFFMLSICLLTASSLQQFKKTSKLSSLFIITALIGFLFYSIAKALQSPLTELQINNLNVLSAFAVLFFSLILLFRFSSSKTEQNVIIVALVILITLELALQMNTLRPKRYSPLEVNNSTLKFIQDHHQGSRIFNINRFNSIPPEWGAANGIRQISMFTSTMLPAYEHLYLKGVSSDSPFFLALEGGSQKDQRPVMESIVKREDPRLVNPVFLDLLGVKYIVFSTATRAINPQYFDEFESAGYERVSGLNQHVYENLNPAPFAWLVCHAKPGNKAPVSRPEEFYEYAFINADHYQQLDKTNLSSSSTRCDHEADIKLESFKNTSVQLSVNSARDGILVTSEAWHRNWKVFIDGTEHQLLKTNRAFRGVYLPKGQHTVEFSYSPIGYRLGLYLFYIALTLLGSLFLLGMLKRRSTV